MPDCESKKARDHLFFAIRSARRRHQRDLSPLINAVFEWVGRFGEFDATDGTTDETVVQPDLVSSDYFIVPAAERLESFRNDGVR